MATIKNGIIVSFSNTPQAQNDWYGFTEDQLLWLNNLFNSQLDILTLNVMANDQGGNAKTLYSTDDGVNHLTDLLQADLVANGLSSWEGVISAVGSGDQIRIDNGKVDLDLSASIAALTGGSTDINTLAAGDQIIDTFDYAIRLGNGALSWASVTVNIQGSNDAAAITGTDTGSVKEDTSGLISTGGILAVHDPDHDQSIFQEPASLAGIYGNFTFNTATGEWTYTLDHDLADGLAEGQIVHDTVTVSSLDGTSSDTIDVAITGSDEGNILVLADGGASQSFTFQGGPGNEFDTIIGGNGVDTLTVTYTGEQIVQITSDGQDPDGHILIDFDNDGITDLTISGIEELVIDAQNVVATGDLSHTGLADQTIIFNGTSRKDFFDASGMTSTEQVIANGDKNDDTLIGAGGFDTFTGGKGDDTLIGGGGRDWAVYTDATGGITVNLAAGTVTGAGIGTDTLRSIEQIRGSDFADIFDATGFSASSTNAGSIIRVTSFADDKFEGGGGDDTIIGSGNTGLQFDHATGGVTVNLALGTATGDLSVGTDTFSGVTSVIGSNFDDSFVGNANNNRFQGGAGNDTINGGAGNDFAQYLNSSSGVVVNLATGTASDGYGTTDTLISIESVQGSSFADTIIGDANGNTLAGGAGNDTLDGGAGFDTAQYSAAPTGVVVNLATGTASDGFGTTNSLFNIENVTGSDFADSIVGDGNNNSLTGGVGADTISGGAGNDTILPVTSTTIDDAADIIDGGLGSDTVNYSGYTTDLTVALNGSTPTTVFGSGSTVATSDSIVNIENFTGGSGNDIIAGDANSNRLVGGAGDDTISGGDGQDFLTGGAGNDFMDGGANPQGNPDQVTYSSATSGIIVNLSTGLASDGLGGTDTLVNIEGVSGSVFADTITGSLAGTELFEGGGNDIIDGGGHITGGFGDFVQYVNTATAAVVVDLSTGTATDGLGGTDTLINIQSVNASSFNDTITGSSEANLLRGFSGADTIYGGNGNDQIEGDQNSNPALTGNDSLYGQGGNDTIYGNAGNDLIDGGTGNDTLTGGSGSDTFVFAPGSGADTITDFTVGSGTGHDVIELDQSIFADFAALQAANVISQQGTNTVITLGADTITLTGVTASLLDQSNFLFVA